MTGRWQLLSMLALGLYLPPLQAQNGVLTGVVTDALTGNPVTGAAVQLVEANRGVLTNVDGQYQMNGILPATYTARVTSIGFASVEQPLTVSSGEQMVDFQLESHPVALDAVVVTAQQIERQAREIAYSVSRIEAEDLTAVRETNFVNSLAGRAPGVEVLTSSGDVGASTRIVIRGVSSLSGNNQPLFIVDGVPISNSNIIAGTSQDRLSGAIDVGNRGADLSADDIESVTVLKGAAAAALYGQRAKDGVILITTKQGRGVGGQTVSASMTLRVSSPLVLPDFQNEFAQGFAGSYQAASLNGWGPRIEGQEVENIRGETVTLRPFENNVRDFYEDAVLAINTFSVSAADERADFRLGVTYQDQAGIVPASDQQRTSVNVNTGYRVLPNLTARLSGFYVTTDSHGRAVAGGNDPNVLTSIVNGLPRTFDVNDLREYKDEAGVQRALDNFNNNPYWIANENAFQQDIERIFGNAQLVFSPVEWLTFTGRAGLDSYTEDRRNVNAVGTVGRENGLFTLDILQERQLNTDILAEATRDLNGDLNLRAVVGGNLNYRELSIQRNRASDLTVPGLYNFANAESNTPVNGSLERRLYGVFMDATLGYRDYLFLNVTGRNDWSSTLPQDNNSFFYPSVNVSFIATDAFNIVSDVLSFAKLRVNYAQVGSDEAPYQLKFRYFPVEDVFGQYGTGSTFPYGGQTGFGATDVIPPADLRPQSKASFELGGEVQLFEGRAGIDFTYYDERIKDQILSIPIPESTGFAANRTNVGEISNRGIEAQLNLTPIRTPEVTWDMFVNYHSNKNEVESLAEGVDELIIVSAFNSLQVKAEPGESFGLYGPGFLRDSISGMPIIDPNTGLRQEGDLVRYGSIDPDFRLGLDNTLRFGQWSLGFLVVWREGGSLYSQTVGYLRRLGLAQETALNRDGTFIDEGVIQNADGSFRPNDVPVQNMQAFWARYASGSIHEGNIFDSSNARLRQVRLDWAVPRSWLERTPFGSLSIGLEGSNLFLFYKKVPHIDPETGSLVRPRTDRGSSGMSFPPHDRSA